MGKVTRKSYSADFQAKVAREAIKGDLTRRGWQPSMASTRR